MDWRSVLLAGAVIFTASFILHVIVWRVKRPRAQITALGVLFFVIPLVLCMMVCVGARVAGIASLSFNEWAGALLLHVSLSLAYIFSYPAAQALSPSLVIAYELGRAHKDGLTRSEIVGLFGAEQAIDERVSDLKGDGFVARSGAGLVLTPLGKVVAGTFIRMRAILGLPPGKG